MLAKRAKPPPDSAFGGTNEWTLPGLPGMAGSGLAGRCGQALAAGGFVAGSLGGTGGSGLSDRNDADDVEASFGPGPGDEGRLPSASNCGDERWLSLLSPDF
ncbi:hypothetical protein V4C53_27165 [Paraburkholderia azotifigens]|uniref:hypothetical protein n=1 Tax=Paraburkholderia azotifigens TaxID=2057004 RepID=UPI00048C2324